MSAAAKTVRRLRQDAEALIEAELPIGDRLAMVADAVELLGKRLLAIEEEVGIDLETVLDYDDMVAMERHEQTLEWVRQVRQTARAEIAKVLNGESVDVTSVVWPVRG